MAATTPTKISPLRQRMLDTLQLRGMAPRTQETYVDAVSRLARHYDRSPELLSADEVQAYLLYLLRERHLARASLNLYGCAFRFLYRTVLALGGEVFQTPLGPAPQALPEVLARDPALALDIGVAQRWYRAARAHAGITKRGGIHTLRHCRRGSPPPAASASCSRCTR